MVNATSSAKTIEFRTQAQKSLHHYLSNLDASKIFSPDDHNIVAMSVPTILSASLSNNARDIRFANDEISLLGETGKAIMVVPGGELSRVYTLKFIEGDEVLKKAFVPAEDKTGNFLLSIRLTAATQAMPGEIKKDKSSLKSVSMLDRFAGNLSKLFSASAESSSVLKRSSAPIKEYLPNRPIDQGWLKIS